jgi:hypothetical protein
MPEFHTAIDEVVSCFALYKHNKIDESSFDDTRTAQILADIGQKVFTGCLFGFFEQVQKKRFGKDYEGIFRHATGCPPFTDISNYYGSLAFSEDQAILLNIENGIAISLQPLMFWEQCNDHKYIDTGHCYLYELQEKSDGKFSFKAIGYNCMCGVSIKNQYETLAKQLLEFKECDLKREVLHVGNVETIK